MSGTDTETGEKKKSLFQRMKEGLTRSTKSLSDGITGIFTKKKLDAATLEELEELLIAADLGLDAAAAVTEAVGKDRYDKEVSPEEIRVILASEIAKVLKPVEHPLEIDGTKKPFVILMAGVNGAGKTTTIGKIGAKLKAEGKSVMLAAGDTFRAAAVEQLKVWGSRIGAPVCSTKVGGDAADRVAPTRRYPLMPAAALMIVLTPLHTRDAMDAVASWRVRGRSVVVVVLDAVELLGPPASESERLGRRLWSLERERRVDELAALGVPVIVLPPEGSITPAVAALGRARRVHQRAGGRR